MKITIKSEKLELTPSITQYINEKIGSLDKFVARFEHQNQAEVSVEISRATNHHHKGEVFYAQANLSVDGTLIRAERSEEDIRAAIDKVKDILKIEIQKYKEKNEVNPDAIRKQKISD